MTTDFGDQQEPSEAATVEDPTGEAAMTRPAADYHGRGGWVYYLVSNGQGPFETVHEARRAYGVAQDEIDTHKFWHRHDPLPKKYADAIEQRKAV